MRPPPDDHFDAEPGKVSAPAPARAIGPARPHPLPALLRGSLDARASSSSPRRPISLTPATSRPLSAFGRQAAWHAWPGWRRTPTRTGFYPYQTRSTQGLKNQSWKDSGDAVLYAGRADGARSDRHGRHSGPDVRRQAGPIALAFAVKGDHARATQTAGRSATTLKERFNAALLDAGGERYFAIALDPDGHQVTSVASDPGACLAYGIVDDDKAQSRRGPPAGQGYVLGLGHQDAVEPTIPRSIPFAYHLGSVWPSPNSIAAYGLDALRLRQPHAPAWRKDCSPQARCSISTGCPKCSAATHAMRATPIRASIPARVRRRHGRRAPSSSSYTPCSD